MSIKAKLVKIFKEVGKIDFSKIKMEGVDIFSAEEILKIRGVFEDNDVVPMTSTQYDFEKKVVRIHINFIYEGEDEYSITVEHAISDRLWGGGNLSLANKWAHILWLMIGTKDDLQLREKNRNEILGNAINGPIIPIVNPPSENDPEVVYDSTGKIPKEIKMSVHIDDNAFKDKEKAEKALREAPSKTLADLGKITTPTDHVASLIDTVVKETGLPEEIKIEKPEKKDPEPSQALMDRINEGNWEIKVKLHECVSETTVVKALDTRYGSKATELYGHPDNDLCPINPYQVIDKFPRRSNLKIRRAIIQFRVFGEEAFWKALMADTNSTKEEIIGLMTLPKTPPKEEEQPPVKIIHNLNLNFEIPEHLGNDRSEEVCHRLRASINSFGIPDFSIIYALNKMKDKPEIDMTSGDNGIITQFLAKASKLQIEEMIKTAQAAG